MSKSPNIALIRGAFLNPWEMQNYEPLKKRFNLVAFSSLRSLLPRCLDQTTPGVDLIKLPSPMDLPNFSYKMPILNRLFIDAHWLFGLEEKLKGFEIAHAAETYYAYTHQVLEAKRRGIIKKVISTCWEIIPRNNEGIWGRKKWKETAIKEVDHFICPTLLAKRCLIEEGCDPKKISVVRMGVDLNKFKMQKPALPAGRSKIKRMISAKWTMQNAKINILYVGRMETEKGVWELVEAFKELKKQYRNISLTMIGEGREKTNLARSALASLQGLTLNGKIRLMEGLDYEKITKEYQKADIFVLPSKPTKTWQEQYGMVLVEAMAAGLPIVATKTGAIPEVLGGIGILVEPGNLEQLTKALLFLAQNLTKRMALGKKARKRAKEEFDRKKSARKIEEIYDYLLRKDPACCKVFPFSK